MGPKKRYGADKHYDGAYVSDFAKANQGKANMSAPTASRFKPTKETEAPVEASYNVASSSFDKANQFNPKGGMSSAQPRFKEKQPETAAVEVNVTHSSFGGASGKASMAQGGSRFRQTRETKEAESMPDQSYNTPSAFDSAARGEGKMGKGSGRFKDKKPDESTPDSYSNTTSFADKAAAGPSSQMRSNRSRFKETKEATPDTSVVAKGLGSDVSARPAGWARAAGRQASASERMSTPEVNDVSYTVASSFDKAAGSTAPSASMRAATRFKDKTPEPIPESSAPVASFTDAAHGGASTMASAPRFKEKQQDGPTTDYATPTSEFGAAANKPSGWGKAGGRRQTASERHSAAQMNDTTFIVESSFDKSAKQKRGTMGAGRDRFKETKAGNPDSSFVARDTMGVRAAGQTGAMSSTMRSGASRFKTVQANESSSETTAPRLSEMERSAMENKAGSMSRRTSNSRDSWM